MDTARLKWLLESIDRSKQIPWGMTDFEQREFIRCGLAEEPLASMSIALDSDPNQILPSHVEYPMPLTGHLTKKGKRMLEKLRDG